MKRLSCRTSQATEHEGQVRRAPLKTTRQHRIVDDQAPGSEKVASEPTSDASTDFLEEEQVLQMISEGCPN